MRIFLLVFVLQISHAVVSNGNQYGLSLREDIDQFISDDVVGPFPFETEGREDEIRKIIRSKMAGWKNGGELLSGSVIARKIGDEDLYKDLLRKALECLISEEIDPIHEHIILERLSSVSDKSDVDLLQRFVDNGKFSMPASKQYVERMIAKSVEIEQREPLRGERPVEESPVNAAPEVRKPQVPPRVASEKPESSRWPLVFAGVAVFGTFLLIRVFSRGRAS